MSDLHLDTELYEQICAKMKEIRDEELTPLIDKMERELESIVNPNGESRDGAYNLVNIIMLREVFWRKTVSIAVAESRGEDSEDLLEWITQEMENWGKEAPCSD